MLIILVAIVVEAILFFILKSFVDIQILNFILIAVQTAVIIYAFKKKTVTRIVFVLLIISYVLKLGYMFFDIYANGTYLILKDYIDSASFHRHAEEMINGLKQIGGSNKGHYPDFLYLVYKVFGVNRMMGQYLNITMITITQLLFLKVAGILGIKEKKIIFPMAVFCLFPASFLFSTMLIRESLIILLLATSLYCFLYWLKRGGAIYAVISILVIFPAIILHDGCIYMVPLFIFMFSFYNRKKEKFVWSWKPLIIIGGGLLIFSIIFILYRDLFFQKLSFVSNNGLKSLYEFLSFRAGDSAYLTNISYSSLWDIFKYAPLRVFYFIVAPVPWEWRGLQDILTFLADSLFYILVIMSIIPLYLRCEKSKRLIFIIIVIQFILFLTIFSHGIYTAGAAVRHRFKSLYMILTMYIISKDGDPFGISGFIYKLTSKKQKRMKNTTNKG